MATSFEVSFRGEYNVALRGVYLLKRGIEYYNGLNGCAEMAVIRVPALLACNRWGPPERAVAPDLC
jgi:hypothetical protein